MLMMLRPHKCVVAICSTSDAEKVRSALDIEGAHYTTHPVNFRAGAVDYPSERIECVVEVGLVAPVMRLLRGLQSSGLPMRLFEYEVGVPI